MFLYKYVSFTIISLTLITVEAQDVDIISNLIDGVTNPLQNLENDLYRLENQILTSVEEKVDVQMYYECLCPDCRIFDTMQLTPTVEKLASNLQLRVYPYGNAQTIDYGNGTFDFNCQHGPEECYGNKLHACAIDYLGNMTKAVFYNSCMMESSQNGRGSDDEAADKCGKSLGIDSEAIKQCAKSNKGTLLLKYYGEESKKVGFKYVPYILINGAPNDGTNFMKDLCAAFQTPPPACAQIN